LSETEAAKEQFVEKLETNKHLLQQLNNDDNAPIETETGQTPVIPLRPAYASSEVSAAQAGINYH